MDRDAAGSVYISVHISRVDNPVIMHKSIIDSTGFDSYVRLQIGIIIDLRWLVG